MGERVVCKICKILGQPNVDLLASWMSHQLQAYMSWRLDLFFKAVDTLQQIWTHIYPYLFPPFSLIKEVLQKMHKDSFKIISITLTWQSQPPPWYLWLLKMSITNSIHLPNRNSTFWGWFLATNGNKEIIETSCKTHHKFQMNRYESSLQIRLK